MISNIHIASYLQKIVPYLEVFTVISPLILSGLLKKSKMYFFGIVGASFYVLRKMQKGAR